MIAALFSFKRAWRGEVIRFANALQRVEVTRHRSNAIVLDPRRHR